MRGTHARRQPIIDLRTQFAKFVEKVYSNLISGTYLATLAKNSSGHGIKHKVTCVRRVCVVCALMR